MAIAMQQRFPIPELSTHRVRLSPDAKGFIDIGWCDGVLSDGRHFRSRLWAENTVSYVSIFFSTIDVPELEDQAMRNFLE